jgi:hypothetical protein
VPTLRLTDVTDGQEVVHGSQTQCPHCHHRIHWMITYQGGRPAPFDPEPLPTRYDTEHTGWAPGMFPIQGHPRLCMAPRNEHTRQPANVLNLHTCQEAA